MTRLTKGVVVGLAAASLALSGCGGQDAKRDVEGVPSQDADSYTVINNVDGHPNLVILCYDGVAFLTTTRDYQQVERVPELDHTCPGGE